MTFHIESREDNVFNNAFIDIARHYPGWYKRINFKHGDSDKVAVEIDGLRSRPVYTTERLQDLLQHC